MGNAAEDKEMNAFNTGALSGVRGREALLLDRGQMVNIIKSMGDSLMVLSPDAEVWFANKATEHMLGYGDGELAGKALGEVISDENLGFFNALRQMITQGPIRDFRLNYMSKEGKPVPVMLNGSVLREDGTGKFLGMALVGRDMRDVLGLLQEVEEAREGLEKKVKERTWELEEALRELKDAQAQLLQREKMASIGQLAAGVAHEINNPVGFLLSNLGAIEGYLKDFIGLVRFYDGAIGSVAQTCENAANLVREIEEQKKSIDLDYIFRDALVVVKESRDGAERVRKIVADLKEFSHVDSSEMAYADLNRCLESTLNIARNEIKHKAKVVKDFGEIPQIRCNAGELNQVFMNMLINASQAISEFGEIGIKTYFKDGSVVIEIRDNGSGIAPEDLKRLFDPFFTTKPVGVGTGLGLTISYKIIKRHNGEITVESEKGRGTFFRITLPADPDGGERP